MHNRKLEQVKIDFVNLPDYSSTTQYITKRIIPLLQKSRLILDAGCGRWNRMVIERESRCWVGSDINLQSLKDNKQITFGIVSDIQKQGFKSEVFDLIVSNDVVEHLEDPKLFIRACHKMLKNKGHLVIATPNRSSLYGVLVAKTSHWVKQNIFKIVFRVGCANEVHYYRLNTPSVLNSVLLTNGFSEVSIVILNKLSSGNFKVRLLWSWYYHLCKFPIMRKFSPGLFCIARKN